MIADSFKEIVTIMKKLAVFSLNKKDRELSQREDEYFRGLSSEELFFRMPKWKLFILVIGVRIAMIGMMKDIRPIVGIREELKKLKEENYTLGIISSNYSSSIRKFLVDNELDYFDFVYSSSVFLRKEKKLKEVLEARKFSAEEVIFIGDETRDIEAAKKAGVKIVSVSWGFTTKKILEKYAPNYLIERSEKLASLIKEI